MIDDDGVSKPIRRERIVIENKTAARKPPLSSITKVWIIDLAYDLIT